MNSPQLNTDIKYSYADYLLWDDNKRYELFNGKVDAMTPAPASQHQRISIKLIGEFIFFLKNNNTCEVFHAPFDVRLPKSEIEKKDKDIYTVVQPDIVVICDKDKIDERGCIGAPDLIVEILSPSTSKKDVDDKYKFYEEAGVKEYWLVHPQEKTLTVFVLHDKKFKFQKIYSEADKVNVNIFQNLTIDLSYIFSSITDH
ncbi:MAG: hypothetical protein B6D61_02095 [Bacteroidetes bacterium 4484_249]|nr:MAG: hypothetical protein B6D61_02095 [Bacteroidetes bacterium 4484_249]